MRHAAIVYEDILRMNRLAYGAAVFCLLLVPWDHGTDPGILRT